MSIDIFVRTAHLPGSIHAFSRQNPDGSITVIVNEDLDMAGRQAAYTHELDHILGNDFEKATATIAEISRERRMKR